MGLVHVGQFVEGKPRVFDSGSLVGPALEEISNEMQGKITVAKLNIDENPQTPSKYGIRGIPTLMVFKNGQVAATKVGALPKGKLVEWINSVL